MHSMPPFPKLAKACKMHIFPPFSKLEKIEKCETRCTEIEADTDAVRKFIETRLNL